jgi:hypothetical protein
MASTLLSSYPTSLSTIFCYSVLAGLVEGFERNYDEH